MTTETVEDQEEIIKEEEETKEGGNDFLGHEKTHDVSSRPKNRKSKTRLDLCYCPFFFEIYFFF